MKLNSYNTDLKSKLSEFDLWITPSLGEIKDTEQFKVEVEKLNLGFNTLALITNNYNNVVSCSAANIADNLLPIINAASNKQAIKTLISVIDVIYFATGKTDNNIKCQFPIYIRKELRRDIVPTATKKGLLSQKSVPRTYGASAVISDIVSLSGHVDEQGFLVASFFQLLIPDEINARQLWGMGTSYVMLKKAENELSLLGPLVISQSRGSITATMGHLPEIILRRYMLDWGMIPGEDFNNQDVTLDAFFPEEKSSKDLKKRKYDFIIPYLSRKDCKRIFIQSQFYAGDSGSVSHKVVDQTDSTRAITLEKYPLAVFMEYLDRAGYYSSLNGDLKKMLAKPTTYNFFQIKTAPIKLRRGLQEIQFLTSLEIEHAIILTDGTQNKVEKVLLNDGYSSDEIKNGIDNAVQNGVVISSGNQLLIKSERKQIVRCYCILDCLANYGNPIPADKVSGYLLVPGYEVHWGMPQNDLVAKVLEIAPQIGLEWINVKVAFDDIQWLLDKEFIQAC